MLSWKNFMFGTLVVAGLGFKRWLALSNFREPSKQGIEDNMDCYFDPECHAKVDWDAVDDLKKVIFAKLEYFRQQADTASVKPFMQKMSLGCLKAGVPGDRIDYILTKWLEFIHPEALGKVYGNSTLAVRGFECGNGYGDDINQEYRFQGTTKDGRPYYQGTQQPEHYIYYDSYCADDTREPRWLLGRRPDVGRDFDLNAFDGQGCNNDFSIVSGSKHFPGGLQKLAWQWCGVRGFTGRELAVVYRILDKTAWPAEKKWDTVDTEDCYFDKECHAKVDWSKVGPLKEGVFTRLKALKEKHDLDGMKELARGAHLRLAALGMPEDRIDYVVTKWLKYGFPEAFNFDATAQKTAPDACAKYASWGELAVSGCKGCNSSFPGRVDDCMRCGSECFPKFCSDSPDKKACVHQFPFMACHGACMQKAASADKAPASVCGKFAGRPLAQKGCQQCDSTFSGRMGECMGCGRKCFWKLCKGKDKADFAGCAASKEMSKCHGTCMGGVQLIV